MLCILHIPHTAIYPVLNIMSNELIEHLYVKSEKSRADALAIEDRKVYFILRNPVERVMKEYVGAHADDDVSLKEYITQETKRNVMSKFILCKHDFSEPITDEDYEKILDLLKRGQLFYDFFNSDKTKYKSLLELTGVDMYDYKVTYEFERKKNTGDTERFRTYDSVFKLTDMNYYDMELYKSLKGILS